MIETNICSNGLKPPISLCFFQFPSFVLKRSMGTVTLVIEQSNWNPAFQYEIYVFMYSIYVHTPEV